MDNFETVKKIIDEWDPYGLLAGGAPEDEFDSESRAVSIKICFENSVQEIARVISNVFSNSFETEYFSVDNCMEAANKIKNNMDNNLP